MSELTINTTQNVNINFTSASIGERILAFFIDMIIKIAYSIIIFYFIFEILGLDNFLNGFDYWSDMAIRILFFIPFIFYTLFFESILEGQTLGKRIVKIKVVKIDGFQASFGDYLMRWLFRVVDIISNLGLVGIISIVISDKQQRLGDMAAGTAVITLKNKVTINSTILEEIDEEYQPTYPLVIKLSDNDMRIIKDTFQKSVIKGDVEMIIKLKDKIESVTGIKNTSGNNKDFIRTILKDYNYYTQNM